MVSILFFLFRSFGMYVIVCQIELSDLPDVSDVWNEQKNNQINGQKA